MTSSRWASCSASRRLRRHERGVRPLVPYRPTHPLRGQARSRDTRTARLDPHDGVHHLITRRGVAVLAVREVRPPHRQPSPPFVATVPWTGDGARGRVGGMQRTRPDDQLQRQLDPCRPDGRSVLLRESSPSDPGDKCSSTPAAIRTRCSARSGCGPGSGCSTSGCGTGDYLRVMAPLVAPGRAVGIDLSAELLALRRTALAGRAGHGPPSGRGLRPAVRRWVVRSGHGYPGAGPSPPTWDGGQGAAPGAGARRTVGHRGMGLGQHLPGPDRSRSRSAIHASGVRSDEQRADRARIGLGSWAVRDSARSASCPRCGSCASWVPPTSG